MKIVYTEKATRDIDRLYVFVMSHNSVAAKKITDRLKQAIERIADFPMLGRKVKGTAENISLRELIVDNYIIRYLVLTNEILVLRVWHGKENRPSVIYF